jgi:CDP-diacylglycerol---glycerol-3-phosphate 3-phosphatidyltransferase
LIGSKIGHSLDPLLLGAYRVLFLHRPVSPNTLTVCGLFLSLFVFYFVAARLQLLVGGLFLVAAGFFDLLDGAVARSTNTITRFGGFLDSVLDRYSDLLIMFGICIYFLRMSDPFYSMATFFAAIGVAIVPYARARAEAASIACSNGVLERPERIILLVVGLTFGILRPVVLILAVLAHVTVFQRVWLVRSASRGQ